jgi:hypothetical protein
MAHRFAVFAFGNALGGEEKSPSNLAADVFVFHSDGIGEINANVAANVRLVQWRDARDVWP